MSNEQFFLRAVAAEFIDLENEKVVIESSMRVYYFRYTHPDGTSSIYKIRFNQIGGYIDYSEVQR